MTSFSYLLLATDLDHRWSAASERNKYIYSGVQEVSIVAFQPDGPGFLSSHHRTTSLDTHLLISISFLKII